VAGLCALAVVAVAAWPDRSAPLDPAAIWSERAAPAVDALALDLSAATAEAGVSSPSAQRLARDLARAERLARPPDPARAHIWEKTLADVRAALADRRVDPVAASSHLNVAALEISGLTAAGQAQ
jgi:hypothetical protein